VDNVSRRRYLERMSFSARVAWLMGVLLVGLEAQGCGRASESNGGPPTAGQSGDAAGGDAAGGDAAGGAPAGGDAAGGAGPDSAGADAGGAGGEIGDAMGGAPPAGACAEVLRLEGKSANYRLNATPMRLHDGFVYLEASSQAEFGWLVATSRGDWREIATNATFSPYLTPLPTGSAKEPQLLLFDRVVDGFTGQLTAQAVREDGASVAPLAAVLSIFDRGTAAYPRATALDGKRAAVGNGHVRTRDPHFILLDQNAQPVGDEHRLFDSGDSPLFSCFTLTGTAHGVLASVVDDSKQELHLQELDAAGALLSETTWSSPELGLCPLVSVDPTGTYLSFKGSTDQRRISVYRFAENAMTAVATLPIPADVQTYRWLVGGDEPLLGVTDMNGALSFARVRQGTVLPLSGGVSDGTVIPSADGRVFVASRTDDESTTPSGSNFTIIELACGAATE